MLTITVTTHNGQPLALPLSADFGETGGTIGRAPENPLVLPDPDRKISRTHASVFLRDGAYTLRDQGSVVPVLLNGQSMGNGRESAIASGDEIRVAGYAMRVDVKQPQRALQPQAAEPPSAIASDPGDAPKDAMTEPVLSWSDDVPSGPGEGIRTVILPSPGHAVAGPAAHDRPQGQASVAPHAAAAESATAPAAASGVVANEELLRALLAGAGLRDVEIPGGLTPQLMNQLGQLLREATRGLLDLLAARALTKREVRADMTVIVAKDNNPLKFSPNMDAALSHLLAPRGRGFMPPLRAVGDAYDDLRAHQLGFMAGMRSALAVVLARFDPQELEQRLTERSMVDSIMPMNRKAKLWDLFGQLYGDITKEAESDFHSLFGQEFLRAYQAQVAKLPDRVDPGSGR